VKTNRKGAGRGASGGEINVVRRQPPSANRRKGRKATRGAKPATTHHQQSTSSEEIMTSQEVLDAIGAAPPREPNTVMDRLEAKRRELVEAEAALAEAEQSMNTDAAVAASTRADVLRRFIARLEREAADELEANAKRHAEQWIAKERRSLTTAAEKIANQQAVIGAKLADLVEAIQVEAELRESGSLFDLAAEVLCARFGLPLPPKGVSDAAQPPLQDWATPVITAVDVMRPSRRERRRLIVGRQASDSARQLRAKTLRAAIELMDETERQLAKHRARKRPYAPAIPEEVLAIWRAAPVPATALEDEPPNRDEAGVGGMSAAVQRALAAIPGNVGITSI
jgi:hypothetical protein